MSRRRAWLTPGTGNPIGVVVALSDLLLAHAIRARLETEPDIAVVGVVHGLADAIDAAHASGVDVVILGTALLPDLADQPPRDLQSLTGVARLVLLSAPSSTGVQHWADALRAVDVVHPLESPDRLLMAIRSSGR